MPDTKKPATPSSGLPASGLVASEVRRHPATGARRRQLPPHQMQLAHPQRRAQRRGPWPAPGQQIDRDRRRVVTVAVAQRPAASGESQQRGDVAIVVREPEADAVLGVGGGYFEAHLRGGRHNRNCWHRHSRRRHRRSSLSCQHGGGTLARRVHIRFGLSLGEHCDRQHERG